MYECYVIILWCGVCVLTENRLDAVILRFWLLSCVFLGTVHVSLQGSAEKCLGKTSDAQYVENCSHTIISRYQSYHTWHHLYWPTFLRFIDQILHAWYQISHSPTQASIGAFKNTAAECVALLYLVIWHMIKLTWIQKVSLSFWCHQS